MTTDKLIIRYGGYQGPETVLKFGRRLGGMRFKAGQARAVWADEATSAVDLGDFARCLEPGDVAKKFGVKIGAVKALVQDVDVDGERRSLVVMDRETSRELSKLRQQAAGAAGGDE